MLDLAQLRITFIAGTLGQGGAERQLFYMAKALNESGARVRILSLTRQEFWEEKIARLGVPVIWVGQSGSRVIRLRRIIAELRNHPPDIVQSQHFFTNLYAVGAARALGLREVGAMRNNAVSEVRANGPLLGRLSLHAPRSLAANSRQAIDNAMAMGISSRRLYFLPNVISGQEFPFREKPESDAITLITVGRLTRQKRVDRFLRLLAKLRQQRQGKIKGQVIGEGPLRQQLERQAIELNLGPDILEFKGEVANPSPLYRQADIFVLTSDWEGTPNVVLEAMASGLPVVSTRVGGLSEIVRHGETGYLLEPANPDAMVKAVDRLCANPSLRKDLGQRASESIRSNYLVEKLPEFLGGLYEAVLL